MVVPDGNTEVSDTHREKIQHTVEVGTITIGFARGLLAERRLA